MKSVYSSPHLFWVTYYQNILQSHGIESFIKNEYLSGGAGELPPNECWPRLFVNDADFDRAEQIVQAELNTPPVDAPPWICAQCGEQNEGQFALCWKCGTPCDDKKVG
ncbi:MAG: DUF2007 domain-containing protein [Gammaproteobacteria bacterium]|jgi:hypothetical protein|nr:DUF2007 domain-containing protein [Gammaproteobacteria bacterium]